MKRITKFKSRNLLGETPKEEDTRLLNARVKVMLKKQDVSIAKEIRRGGKGYLAGTTVHQRSLRNRILKKGGLL